MTIRSAAPHTKVLGNDRRRLTPKGVVPGGGQAIKVPSTGGSVSASICHHCPAEKPKEIISSWLRPLRIERSDEESPQSTSRRGRYGEVCFRHSGRCWGRFGYFLSCGAPIATDVLPLLIEKYLAKVALQAVLDREMPKTALVKVLFIKLPGFHSEHNFTFL
jgi:hypothetical protein